MITVQDKALRQAKKVGGSFLIRNNVNAMMCCSGKEVRTSAVVVELLHGAPAEDVREECHVEEAGGVKIYVQNKLKIGDDASILMLPKMPLMKPIFDARGITV